MCIASRFLWSLAEKIKAVRILGGGLVMLGVLMTPFDSIVVQAKPEKSVADKPRGMSVQPAKKKSSRSRAMSFAEQRYRRRVALIIGIDKYDEPWPTLGAATTDAKHMAALFSAMGFDEVIFLEEEDATRAGILNVLENELLEVIEERDLLVVFFAGHGATSDAESYLIARDSSRNLEQTALSLEQLRRVSLRLGNRHTIYLIDACFSGSLTQDIKVEQTNSLAYWEATARDRTVQILTAGAVGESVIERDGWGLFTRATYDGLAGAADRNGDEVVTFEELAVYTRLRVVQASEDRQHPQWKTIEGSGTALFLDARRIPMGSQRGSSRRAHSSERPKSNALKARELMTHELWSEAEKLLRDSLVMRDDCELRLLLAEVYLEVDALGNAELIEKELRGAAKGDCSREQRTRSGALRSRLQEVRNGR